MTLPESQNKRLRIFSGELKQAWANKHPHGTHYRYAGGCRCFSCRLASANYRSLCLQRARAGFENPMVPTDEVVAHLRKLSFSGVGYRAVSDVTGVHQTTLQRMKNGQAKFIRKQTALKILAVTKDLARDNAAIPADQVKRKVNMLVRVGFTTAEIAQRIGLKRLRFSDRIRAKNAMKIEKLYKRVMAA